MTIVLKDLYRMAVFAKVVECGSFSKAAVALGLGRSIVSEHVRTLEKGLATQLINRSPRSFALTEEGRRFYKACLAMTEQAQAALAALDQMQSEPSGTVRISASYNLGLNFLIPALAEYQRLHPKVAIDLSLDDSISNVIEGGFDVCLRTGWLKDSRLYTVRFGSFHLVPCVSPAFLAQRPAPTDPAELASVPWVTITQLPHPDRLEMVNADGQRRSVRIAPAVRTNTGVAARAFVVAGDMVGLLPDYAILDDLREGRLVRLLPGWTTEEGAISAVYPHKEHMTPRLRLLLEHLRVTFQRRYAGTPATERPRGSPPTAKACQLPDAGGANASRHER